MSYDYAFKFILVGDTAVGKTSILSRFLKGTFNRQNDITIGVEFGERTISVNNQTIKLQVWDTAGQEDFRSMTRQYYRSAAAALLVYDCTRPETFKNIIRWVEDVRSNGNRSVILVLICNKIDMAERRVVSRNDGLKLAKEQDLLYIETSAKSDQNIE
jgi:Ras-related protein Rab-2A